MSPKELTAYAKVMRKMGIASLKLDGATTHITLDLSHQSPQTSPKEAPSDAQQPLSDEPSEDMLLSWSSGV